MDKHIAENEMKLVKRKTAVTRALVLFGFYGSWNCTQVRRNSGHLLQAEGPGIRRQCRQDVEHSAMVPALKKAEAGNLPFQCLPQPQSKSNTRAI